MKALIGVLLTTLRQPSSRRNLRLVGVLLAVLAILVAVYTVLFHVLMVAEGRGAEHSWFTGVYWTLTVMSTLGFGDITFHSDLGRAFSSVVLLSGVVVLLIVFPFTFIQFFYAPWIKAQSAARAPRELPPEEKGHVIVTRLDDVTSALIHRLKEFRYPYVLLVPDLNEALALQDRDLRVMVGELDDPETYAHARIERAAMVVTTASDQLNTNVTITVRELSEKVPLIATARETASAELLRMAGCTHVIQLPELMGQWLARRISGADAMTHVIGRFDQILVAEATAHRTPMVGKTLREFRLREVAGVSVVGVWERGRFRAAQAETRISSDMVLVLAGSREQLDRYDQLFCIYNAATAPVLILGGGRVGRAAARFLAERKLDCRIVDRIPERLGNDPRAVVGDAADLEVLKRAGIESAPAVLITTNDDDTNIYLAVYCRQLRPDIQIISRATRERNVSTLHRAGTDFVLSYASLGANAMFNLLKRSGVVMITEGLNLIRLKVPASMEGKTIAETNLRVDTGCTVVAVQEDGKAEINPAPTRTLAPGSEIVMIGDAEAEDRFLERYGPA